ncbi:ABC transporter permease [Methylobacterium sp.]|uniref:ABC transporter permease n=1 Tax=Methylobacterium sp. TaxID=409 RepID=UPI00262E5331|nr:ABC transporter permease [Methylobacterium sp.]MDB5648110.1 transporter permease [Methylobacterium sp.]
MFLFVLQRLAQSLGVMLAVALVAFSLFNFIGDPINSMTGPDTSNAEREALRVQLGLDQGAVVQFRRFVLNAARGRFGKSYQQGRPVAELIGEKLPATLELSMLAALTALVLGVLGGVYTALRRDALSSRVLLTASLVGLSLPTFLIGILLIMVFSVWLGWLPSFGRGDVVQIGPWSTGLLRWEGLRALVLPVATLALFQMALTMRLVRSEMLEVLRADYIRFARARGLPDRIVDFRHALKNTLIPVITVTGLQLGSIIAFSIITESVFQWPGMGLMFIQAVQFGDIPVMSAYLVLIAFLFVMINLVVDLLYYWVDPRMRSQIGGAGGH